jgi:hypothetical protein
MYHNLSVIKLYPKMESLSMRQKGVCQDAQKNSVKAAVLTLKTLANFIEIGYNQPK